MNIRDATRTDAEHIARIYNHYVQETCITFETTPVSAEEMVQRMEEIRDAGLPWLIAEQNSKVMGYAHASKWKGRCAYRYSVESTIYLAPDCAGQGIGKTLYAALIEQIRSLSMHAIIGSIALPNPASIGLHERFGFKKVGQFEQVGFKQERWVDVGYWQLLLQP